MIAVSANTTKIDALALAARCAAIRPVKEPCAKRPADNRKASGSIAICVETMNNPANSASARSFERKTVSLEIGSTSSTRKSVSSGNSEWLTSSVAKATTSIGTPIISASPATLASRYASTLLAVGPIEYMRASSRPNVSSTAMMPISTRRKASDPACDRMPKSNKAAKKCRIRCFMIRRWCRRFPWRRARSPPAWSLGRKSLRALAIHRRAAWPSGAAQPAGPTTG